MLPNAYTTMAVKPALHPVDWATDTEGLLVDITGFRGNALCHLHVYEDASQAATEKLTVTVHNVASDSEALVAGNQVAAFDVIVGSNGSAADVSQSLDVCLEGLTKQYLQLNFVETNTYEANISAVFVLPGKGYLPVNS